jgi:hypothetical protein
MRRFQLLDRLVHNAHRIELTGDSLRKRRKVEPAAASVAAVPRARSSPRLTLTPIRCQKSTGQQAAAPPGGIVPESPGGFAGIRIDVAIERLDERDALT